MVVFRIVFLIFTVTAASAYNPDIQNIYHLFTRANPTFSQPILLNNNALLDGSNFNGLRPTVVIIHGWVGSPTALVNTVLVPAYLQAADVNVIVLDWSVGASLGAGVFAPLNAVASGRSVAGFIDWVVSQTSAVVTSFTLVGHSLGAHQAAVVGRNVIGRISYIVALDPGAYMDLSGHIFTPDVATYTEAIHTNADGLGHGLPVAHVDFYPNGGDYMPGCGINIICNHDRAVHYFGESLTSGGFTGRLCATYFQARLGVCSGFPYISMGGLTAKIGSRGLYHLTTNAASPFSQF